MLVSQFGFRPLLSATRNCSLCFSCTWSVYVGCAFFFGFDWFRFVSFACYCYFVLFYLFFWFGSVRFGVVLFWSVQFHFGSVSLNRFNSFRSVSTRHVTFRFTSFHSFHFTSCRSIPINSIHFISFHFSFFISFHFVFSFVFLFRFRFSLSPVRMAWGDFYEACQLASWGSSRTRGRTWRYSTRSGQSGWRQILTPRCVVTCSVSCLCPWFACVAMICVYVHGSCLCPWFF